MTKEAGIICKGWGKQKEQRKSEGVSCEGKDGNVRAEMGNEGYFQKALSQFTVEFAAGNAIRALADKGDTVEEIHEKLTFPLPKKAIGELTWAHFLDNGTICLSDPKEQPDKIRTSYEKVQNAYGKVSFRQVRKTVTLEGEYVACDFGKRLYQDREAFLRELQRVDAKDRDYLLGLPWPLQTVWHVKDARMERILSALGLGRVEQKGLDGKEKAML